MTRTIFRSVFFVGISVLFLCWLLFFALQYVETNNEAFSEMRRESAYIDTGLEQGGVAYLESLDETMGITWIDADGEVIFDDRGTAGLPNQSGCAEVADALSSGSGTSVRADDSDGESLMYYALLRDDGTVLRLSRPHGALRNALMAANPVLWIVVLVVLISGVLAYRAARQIVQPIDDMDLDNPDAEAYPELMPLIERFQDQKRQIQNEAVERERMRREFTANVSHELKTPLTSISGFAELMANGMVSEDEMRSFSGDVYRESQRLIVLVDDIIKLSQLDEDAVKPKSEDVDLYELAADVLDSLAPVAQRQHVRLDLTGTPAHVSGVYQLLDEMVYNLCDNAIKYNRPGGSVTVEVSEDDASARIVVSDTGIGIPEDHQGRVFERFYRVDKSHSKEIGGTGLGLSIVKHGAQFHGADVELKSETGVGTTIGIVFPKQAAK